MIEFNLFSITYFESGYPGWVGLNICEIETDFFEHFGDGRSLFSIGKQEHGYWFMDLFWFRIFPRVDQEG